MRDSICNDCAKRTRCDMAEIGRSPLAISTCYGYEKGNPSNADRIRAMSDEELAEVLCKARTSCGLVMGDKDCVASCMVCWLDWLQREATDEEG